MDKLPIALGSLTVIVAIVFASLAVAGVFDGSSDAAPGDGDQAETAALCVEGVEDCDDTSAIPDGGGDVADELPPGDVASGTCIEGTVNCEDTVTNDNPGDPISGHDPITRDDAQALAIEAAFAELETMGGPPAAELDVTGVESVTWNNACLGVETPGIACAEVITPGFIVFLSGNSGDYEFHTDTNGHAVLAEPAQ